VGCSPWGRKESDRTERLHFHFSLSRIGEGNGNPLQCSCLENPKDGGAWWAAIYGVAQSRTRLKQLSSSTSSRAFLLAQTLKNLPAMWETQVRSLGGEDPLEKEMATHCSILAWRIPWTEEPGWLQSMGSLMTEQLTCSLFTGGGECRGHAYYSAFAPDTVFVPDFSEVAVGVFWSCYNFCP